MRRLFEVLFLFTLIIPTPASVSFCFFSHEVNGIKIFACHVVMLLMYERKTHKTVPQTLGNVFAPLLDCDGIAGGLREIVYSE